MPRTRLSAAETAAIQMRLGAGESLASIAASLGRSRQSLARIKGAMDRGQARRLDVKLNIRLTEEDRAHFQAVVNARGLTVSEAMRHLVRQASGLLALQADELAGITAARRELASVGNNLNQLARLGAAGKLRWNRGDSLHMRQLACRVDDLSEELVLLLSAIGSRKGLSVEEGIAALRAASGETPATQVPE